MLDLPARRRGRPRLYREAMTTVSTSLPVAALDHLCALALRRGESVSSVARGILLFALRDQTPATTSTSTSTTTSRSTS